MVIICEECGKVYKLDSEKLKKSVKGTSTKIKCKICDHVINLTLTDNDIFSSENPKFDESVDINIEAENKAEDTLSEKIVISEDPKEKNLDKSTKKVKKKITRNKTFVFGIRSKMIFMFLLIPVSLTIGLALFSIKQMDKLATEITFQSTEVVKQLAEESIINKAKSVASQCSIFLKNNPDLNKDDFYFDLDLNRISIQQVGLKGYTALIELPNPEDSDELFTIWCHPDQKLIGKSLLKSFKKNLGNDYDNFNKIIAQLRLGKGNYGYYKWYDNDNVLKDKFIAIEPIEQTKYIIISTTFIDDFTMPIVILKNKSEETTNKTRNANYVICSILILIIGLFIILYGYSLSKNIGKLTDAADRISIGELDVNISIKSNDEIGALAEAIIRMQDSLRFSIERLRKRR
ncbi:MAG: HAMP domain-containing protein [Desulfobacteraceae bacterium]|jgi:HAMP domain-containing protein